MQNVQYRSPYQKNLRAWRNFRGLTLEEAADKLKVHYSTLQRWETGGIVPNSVALTKLCQLYQITAADLLLTPQEVEDNKRAKELLAIAQDLDADGYQALLTIGRRLKPQ